MNNNTKLVTVYRAVGEIEALAIKAMLESFGIPSMLKSHASSSVHVFTVDGLGEVQVMVNQGDYEEAMQLINSRNEDV